MKKLFIFSLALILLLSGCRKTETPQDTTETETVTIETSIETIRPRPLVAVSVPATKETETAEDGTILFHKTTQHIHLTMADSDVAEKVSLDFLNRIDEFSSHGEQIRQTAIAEFNNPDSEIPPYFPYEYGIRYEPKRIDQGILSFFGSEISYAGGIHPDYHCVSANYDLITGETLTLGSILTHENALPSLKALLLAQLNKLKDETQLFDSYKDTINRRFEGDESFDEDWFFTTTGLCFYFSPYEIGPYSSGSIIAEIPYEKLTGIIADEFFPAERELAEGSISITAYADAALSDETLIAELILDPEGESYILQTDKGVLDLTIQCDNYTVFAMQQLAPEDAVLVKVNPETTENLTVIYQSNGAPVSIPFP